MYEELLELLNELLEREANSLLNRLGEARPFVGWADAADLPALRQILAEQGDHQRRLAAAIEQLGGVPRPPRPDTLSGRLNYLDVRHLLPEIIADKQRLVALYRQAAARIRPDLPAQAAVCALLASHRAHLDRLRSMAPRVA